MNIGIIGLGIIGSRVAARYRDAGHTVSLWSRTLRDTPGFLPTSLHVAEAVEMIQIFVNDGSSLLATLRQMEPALGNRHVVVNSSTVSLEVTLEAEALVRAKGAAFLDCPFTGSRDAAGAGQLVYYVGGDAAVLERVREILDKSSKEILPVGEIGQATVLKIVTNMVSATTVQVLSEAMAVTRSCGVPLAAFKRAIESNACCSGLVRMKLPTMIAGDFAPHFSLKNMLKDSRFALDLASKHGLSLPALAAASGSMEKLTESGRGEEDYSVLFAQYEAVAVSK